MINRKNNLYVIPVIMLLLHLMFAGFGFYLYTAFKIDLVSRTTEFLDARSRLQLVNETQLNKDFILAVMSNNVEDYETFMQLFKVLAAIGAVASCLSVAWIIQLHSDRKAAE